MIFNQMRQAKFVNKMIEEVKELTSSQLRVEQEIAILSLHFSKKPCQ